MGDTIQCRDCGGQGYKWVEKRRTDSKGKTTTERTTERCNRCGGSGSVQG